MRDCFGWDRWQAIDRYFQHAYTQNRCTIILRRVDGGFVYIEKAEAW